MSHVHHLQNCRSPDDSGRRCLRRGRLLRWPRTPQRCRVVIRMAQSCRLGSLHAQSRGTSRTHTCICHNMCRRPSKSTHSRIAKHTPPPGRCCTARRSLRGVLRRGLQAMRGSQSSTPLLVTWLVCKALKALRMVETAAVEVMAMVVAAMAAVTEAAPVRSRVARLPAQSHRVTPRDRRCRCCSSCSQPHRQPQCCS